MGALHADSYTSKLQTSTLDYWSSDKMQMPLGWRLTMSECVYIACIHACSMHVCVYMYVLHTYMCA